MKQLWNAIWVLAALCAMMAACDLRTDDYSEYRRLPMEGWRYSDTLAYSPVHIHDSLCPGRVVVGVTHNGTYPFTDLWLEVTQTDRSSLRRDTVVIHVADRFGSWLGSGIGDSFQLTDTLPQVVHPSGTPVTVRHIMRADTIMGINQVGVFFVPSSGHRR